MDGIIGTSVTELLRIILKGLKIVGDFTLKRYDAVAQKLSPSIFRAVSWLAISRLLVLVG